AWGWAGRLSGWCCPYFSNRIMASGLGPARPRGSTANGAGAWLIFSQSRQVNFSRTICTTFHCRGTTSSRSVTSSPSLASLCEPQQAQAWPSTREGANLRGLAARGLLGRNLVLGRRPFELLELKLHLVDEPRLSHFFRRVGLWSSSNLHQA